MAKVTSKTGLEDISEASINPAEEDGNLAKLVGFEIPAHDYIALTYVAAGDGAGEIETVTYKSGGASGDTVATLTLSYNSDDKIESITKS